MRKSATYAGWIPDNYGDGINYNLGVNRHIKATGVMSPDRVHDLEGGTNIVASFQHLVGAVVDVLEYRFALFCCEDSTTGRLRLDDALTTGAGEGHSQAKT